MNNCLFFVKSADKIFNESYGEIKKLTMNPVCAEEFALTFEAAVTFVYFVSSRIVLIMNFILLSYLNDLRSW